MRRAARSCLRRCVCSARTPLTVRRAQLAAAGWAWSAHRQVRAALRNGELDPTPASPPRAVFGGRRGVMVVLRARRATCLERSLVLQAWLSALGHHCDVVVGVRRLDGQVVAHAWLDGTELDGDGYEEIHRIAHARVGSPP